MPQFVSPPTQVDNLAELLEQLGGIPPSRVRLRPPPGTASERHVIQVNDRENRLCELVDGVLVEKAMGAWESLLAGPLLHWISDFLEVHDLGVVLAPDGMLRLLPGLVRIPDVSFISWKRIPGGEFPHDPIPGIVPDLAVEVLSEGNTPGEIRRKLREYFKAGVRLAWLVDPKTKAVNVYTSPTEFRHYRNGQTLDGGDDLPGLAISLRKLFAPRRRRRGNLTNSH